MTLYRIYTISADGQPTLQKEFHASADAVALGIAFSLLRSLPAEVTWLLDCEQEDVAE